MRKEEQNLREGFLICENTVRGALPLTFIARLCDFQRRTRGSLCYHSVAYFGRLPDSNKL